LGGIFYTALIFVFVFRNLAFSGVLLTNLAKKTWGMGVRIRGILEVENLTSL
jgi:hypothetical protein